MITSIFHQTMNQALKATALKVLLAVCTLFALALFAAPQRAAAQTSPDLQLAAFAELRAATEATVAASTELESATSEFIAAADQLEAATTALRATLTGSNPPDPQAVNPPSVNVMPATGHSVSASTADPADSQPKAAILRAGTGTSESHAASQTAAAATDQLPVGSVVPIDRERIADAILDAAQDDTDLGWFAKWRIRRVMESNRPRLRVARERIIDHAASQMLAAEVIEVTPEGAMAAVDWTAVLDFIKELLPVILQIIALF